jgi:hypothetical protein
MRDGKTTHITLPRNEWGTIPKPCHRITKENEKLLINKIISINMGSLLSVREIQQQLYPDSENRRRALRWFRQRGLGATLAGGWFSVAHKENFDRLIYDRRPANATESRLGWAQLPHGSLLTQVVLRGSRCLRGSLHDLRVFFFCLAQPEERVHKNAVGRIWEASDFPDLNLDPAQDYVLCLRVQGMGDLNAVDVAQTVHEEVLKVAGTLREDQVIRYGHPVPAGDSWEGVYVDDHLALQVVADEAAMAGDGRDRDIVRSVKQAYLDTPGLEEAVEKEVLFEPNFTAWGTEVSGVLGFAGAPRERRAGLSCVSALLGARGTADKKTLEKVIHSTTHPFMHRTEFFSIYAEAYRFMDRCDYGKVYKLPRQVREELFIAALLLPLCEATCDGA